MTIYIFPMFSNIMIGILILILIIVTFFGANQLVYAQVPATNSTPIFVVQPQATQEIQQVAQQTDNNTLIGIASLVVTTVVAPLIVKITRDKDKKTDEHAKELHNENEFRIEASTEALREMNNSIKATDKGNLEGFKIIQALFQPFKETENLKKAYDKITVEGVPVLDALDNFVRDSQSDLEDYYNGENEKKDKFDTCNDPIVQKLALVRNKSKK